MKAFISYSHRDATALDRLHVHLTMLHREGLIEEWFDREILAGSSIDGDVNSQLEECGLFLLLVSPDFLHSDYCYEREMKRALERHEAGEARVVPIIVEPCEWTKSPLGKLKAVPRDGLPVSEWTNANNAYLNIVQELRRILEAEQLRPRPAPAQTAPVNEERPAASARRYRVTREFDEIDRAEFREQAFEQIRNYFDRALQELEGIDDLRGRFVALSPTSFGATIVNSARSSRGTAHITVHRQSGGHGMGDIYYSFSENSPPNTSNGGFSIDNDDYELYLSNGSFGFRQSEEGMTPVQAAEHLWTEFLEQAGVSYE
jgi:hypothetical protein